MMHMLCVARLLHRDARTILERSIKLNETAEITNEAGETLYRGQAGYKSFVKKDMAQVSANKISGSVAS
jgi:hypothetical protein